MALGCYTPFSLSVTVVLRLVTLTCSNTEIVAALGFGDAIVGVDDHSDFPPEVVNRARKVGPDLSVDPEKVAELRPDLVLASLTVPGHERVVEALERAGLPLMVLSPVSISDVYDDVMLIAERLGALDRGRQLVRQMQAELVAVDPGPHRPRILIEWWPKPVIVPGRRSWVHQLLELVGAENPLGDRDVESTPITDQEAVELRPDAVVISWCGVRLDKYRPHVVYRREAWQGLPALEHRHVYKISEAYLGRPGPRLVEGYRALRDVAFRVRQERTGAP